MDKLLGFFGLDNKSYQTPVKENSINFLTEILTESLPDNCLSRVDNLISLGNVPSFLPYSGEGFAENEDKQKELAVFIFSRFLQGKEGAFLDAGFGSNIHVANTMAEKGVESFALDQLAGHAGADKIWNAPTVVETNAEKVKICQGDIARIDEVGSILHDKRFGLVLFNGSWNSTGNNWTVSGEVMEARFHNQKNKRTSMNRYMSEQKDFILSNCVKRLSPKGVVGIVSPRYAFHGGGYNFNSLPEEKMVFFDAMERLSRLKAKKFYMVGLSREGVRKVIDFSLKVIQQGRVPILNSVEIEEVVNQLADVNKLPVEDVYSRYGDDKSYQLERNQRVKQFVIDHPELHGVARIDAIFAEF
ncbi:TPA: hypothetical protein DD448_03900 [Candidatus Collierbacteria bacterium]|nr:MAG: hypothetical protein UX40_C0022G0010 [Microgenomates group bacterium GW2011_GWF2_46_18]HBO11058.1 hypothetical protein [Candidatus Collierbacteria bacterium]